MLREWQEACAEAALDKYRSGSSHFLCLACPGAGKTVMAAEVAKRMLGHGMVDLIICFAPSTTVVSSTESTFSRILERNFCGGLGAAGAAYTYHNLLYFSERFWDSLQRHRLLVIFDEIHHCSGDAADNANAWGGEILGRVQKCARYTMALSGTPWRTDNVPVVLSDYAAPDGELCCDYVYGLHEAIADNVCRKPKIALINSHNVVLSSAGTSKRFGSIPECLNENAVSYQSILWHPEAMKHVLSAGCEKLREIRRVNADAGGLVVASSVEHARKLLAVLENDFAQSAIIVTYHDKEALSKIAQYRQGTTEWIVSVGMISEGTDIPRLQVCCHLSTVKTELYFRQVLGRILRVNQRENQEAWLFSMATEELILYAGRLADNLPADYCVLHRQAGEETLLRNAERAPSPDLPPEGGIKAVQGDGFTVEFNAGVNSPYSAPGHNPHLAMGMLYQQVIDAFLYSPAR